MPLREKDRLEIRLPSGIWKNYKKADPEYVEQMLEDEQLHLFRKAKKSKKKSIKNKKEESKKKNSKKKKKDKNKK